MGGEDELPKMGADLPKMDAFEELMNICRAVQGLQKNLESLTMQADDEWGT